MNPLEAIDTVFGIVKAAWDQTGFKMLYDDKTGEIPTNEAPWARATIQHVAGRQSSLSDQSGTKRHTETGLLTVQVFAPVGDGSTRCYELATLLRNALREVRHSEVWFRNVYFNEIGTDGAFRQINVLATFSYDDVR